MQVMWQLYKNSSFVLKMTLGFLLGIVTGVLFGPSIEMIKPLGTILINLLNLVAIPVIFLTVVIAINQMNPK
ncbi:cation:dicarboxylase symporter family transporter, partial [Micrococcus sp. SIMBA_131]